MTTAEPLIKSLKRENALSALWLRIKWKQLRILNGDGIRYFSKYLSVQVSFDFAIQRAINYLKFCHRWQTLLLLTTQNRGFQCKQSIIVCCKNKWKNKIKGKERRDQVKVGFGNPNNEMDVFCKLTILGLFLFIIVFLIEFTVDIGM